MPNRLDLDQTHKNLVRLLERKLRPIHYREAFNESKVWSTESYSDRTNPVEKFRQRYAEHDHDDVFFIAGGHMALARWFPIRPQMRLLAPQETVAIEGNCIVSFDAGYETAMREPYMLNKFGKNKQAWYERRRHGMLVEHHVANYFRRHYPQYFRDPTNKGDYEKPAKEDFILQTEWNKIIVDVKSVGDFRQGECDTFVVTDPNEVSIYIVADFCEHTNIVTMKGMTTGNIVKLLGEKSTRSDDLYFVATNHLWSVEPLLVMLNMADCNMEYSEYKRNIKSVELAQQAA